MVLRTVEPMSCKPTYVTKHGLCVSKLRNGYFVQLLSYNTHMLFTVQFGSTAVLLACQFGYRELLEILIDKYHCAATDKDKACC